MNQEFGSVIGGVDIKEQEGVGSMYSVVGEACDDVERFVYSCCKE